MHFVKFYFFNFSRGSASAGDIYNNYEADKEVWEKLIASKDSENELLREENKYLKEKMDQLLGSVGKKG